MDFRICRPPVGELKNGVTPAAATLPAAPPACPPALKRKESNRLSQSDPFLSFGAFVNGGVYVGPPIVIPLSFPNLSHNYWENYDLTGEYHVKRLEAAPPS